LHPSFGKSDSRFLLVMSLSFLLGMCVGLAVYLAWRFHFVPPQEQGWFVNASLVLCPPFLLTLVAGSALEFDLMLALVTGTIIFANGFLYAGVAAGLYFLFTLWERKRGEHPNRQT
jgi:hypothetical protein